MKKRILKSPTLYKTYKWFLKNVSDDVLKFGDVTLTQ